MWGRTSFSSGIAPAGATDGRATAKMDANVDVDGVWGVWGGYEKRGGMKGGGGGSGGGGEYGRGVWRREEGRESVAREDKMEDATLVAILMRLDGA